MISVVIPAFNEEKSLGKCLDAFQNQTTKENFEIIVVDNGSTDKTLQVLESYKNKLPLKVYFESKKGRGTARYIGFKNAKGEIVLSADSDCVVPHDWIEKMTKTLRKKDAVAVTGTLIVKDIDPIRNLVINKFYVPLITLYKLIYGHYWLAGFSFAIYKNIYEKSGGFNHKINTQEDVDLSFKVSKLGKIRLYKDAPVEFSGRRFKNGIIRGSLPYITTFVSHFWLKKEEILLPDVR